MKKISAVIPDEDFDLLKSLAVQQDISMTDALRRALKNHAWLRNHAATGAVFTYKKPDEKRQIFWLSD